MNVSSLNNLSRAANSVFKVMAEIVVDLDLGNKNMNRDIFAAFYQTAPAMLNETTDWYDDMKTLVHLGLFPKMRTITRRDATMSALATLCAVESIRIWHQLDLMDPDDELARGGPESGGKIYNDLCDLKEIRDKLPDPGKEETEGSGEDTEEKKDSPKSGSGGSGFSNAGLDARNVTSDSSTRIQLLCKLRTDQRLRKMMNLFGQMKEMTSEFKNDNIFLGSGTSALDMGGDISRVPVNEIIKPMELLGRDLANEEALQHANYDEGTKGEGPIAVLIDISGSMNCNMGDPINREDQNDIASMKRIDVAITLAAMLQQICQEQGRHIMIQFFNHNNSTYIDCVDGKISPLQLRELLEKCPMGGTNFRPPVERAIEWIGEHSYEDKADVVMISDGSAGETWYYLLHGTKNKIDWQELNKELREHDCKGRDCDFCFGPIPEDHDHSAKILELRDYWADKKDELERMGVRFWTLQVDDWVDQGLHYISDKVFSGIQDDEQRSEACKSILREMIEIRKPGWLQ